MTKRKPRPHAGKLTPERHQLIVNALRVGATYEVAAGHAGIVRSTLSNWLRRGRESKSGKYRDLYLDAVKARSRPVVGALVTINKAAAGGDWKAAAWIAERRHPEAYSTVAQLRRPDTLDEGEGTAADTVAAVQALADLGAPPDLLVALGQWLAGRKENKS